MWPWVEATKIDLKNAYEIWKFSALSSYITLTWWRKEWVMNEALRWAKENWWLTIWILPTDEKETFSDFLDIPICTNMRSWRNYINVLSSDIVVACWINHWTSSEISLAIKPWKKIVLVWLHKEANDFFLKLSPDQVFIAKDHIEAIKIIKDLLEIWKN